MYLNRGKSAQIGKFRVDNSSLAPASSKLRNKAGASVVRIGSRRGRGFGGRAGGSTEIRRAQHAHSAQTSHLGAIVAQDCVGAGRSHVEFLFCRPNAHAAPDSQQVRLGRFEFRSCGFGFARTRGASRSDVERQMGGRLAPTRRWTAAEFRHVDAGLAAQIRS